MLSKIATAVNINALAPSAWALSTGLTYPTGARFIQKTAANSNDDGYLLVMLADQECIAGRPEQALSLLDAAYSAFDRTIIEY